MADTIPSSGDEQRERKRKLETPSCSASSASPKSLPFPADDGDDLLSEEDELASDEEEEYQRQVDDSDGFDVDYLPHPLGGLVPNEMKDDYSPFYTFLYSKLGIHCYNLQKETNFKLIRIHKYNTNKGGYPFAFYITLDAADTRNNTPCTFQTCVVEYPTPEWGYFSVWTELSRLKVPNGPRATSDVCNERRWRDEAVDDFYKGKMPNWLTKDELAAATDKGQYYELQESDLLGNEWLQLYAEFAFHVRWRGHGGLPSFLPLKMKKVIVQTLESGEDPPHLKLKSNNAIFYMSFRAGNGDPTGMPVVYHAMIRETMDGKPGHIVLEVQCWACKASSE
ncbi:unnamed protein product [Eruca vesicaria subsp. sativa]|uniref:Uncharacterized protein n=1 Tax=Eruca vesicaria subsp. sativa TaxID=29727 RepID=A0ABC8KF84_ERUVS|nr:unnamed protein product [Eruca vesicaria subsp. sativa]